MTADAVCLPLAIVLAGESRWVGHAGRYPMEMVMHIGLWNDLSPTYPWPWMVTSSMPSYSNVGTGWTSAPPDNTCATAGLSDRTDSPSSACSCSDLRMFSCLSYYTDIEEHENAA